MRSRAGRRGLWFFALGVAALPARSAAQGPPLVAGLVAGYTSTEHVWTPSAPTERVNGVVLGGFVDVQTPLDWLTAGVELSYTQRGSDVLLDSGGTPTPGGIRTDYLTFSIRAKASVRLGRARVHLVAGPVSDIVIRSRLDPLLIQVLDDESAAPFGVLVGGGLGFRITDQIGVDVEARLVEGLQSSYKGDLVSAKNRSQELVVRVGMLVAQ